MKWIKCKDRVPDKLKRVLTVTTYGTMSVDCYQVEDKTWGSHIQEMHGGDVIGWMDIPSPPKDWFLTYPGNPSG